MNLASCRHWCTGSWKLWRSRNAAGVRFISRAIGQPTHYTHPDLLGENDVLPGMCKAEFTHRRKRLLEQIGSSHVGMTHGSHLVIIPGASIQYMSGDVPYRFHQNTDLLYLCGLTEPDCVLVLDCPGGSSSLPRHKATLYVQPRNPHRELWDGPRVGPEDAIDFTGVDEAYVADLLGDHLEKYSTMGYCIWYNTENASPLYKQAEVIMDGLTRSPNSSVKEVQNPAHSISHLRLTKSKSELDLMRRAGELAGHAFRAAMSKSRPGVGEAQLESIFEHSVKMGGAQWMSFPPVVAGGSRANVLHYIVNNRVINGDDLVLMDAGCEYHGYVSDVTRTWPVSGKFTAAQQTFYEVVTQTKGELTQLCKPGVTLNYLHSEANEIMLNKLKDVGLISDRWSFSKSIQMVHQMFPHHVGHWLGMDTHDISLVDRNTILSPGMVFTIEPGLYLTHELASHIDTPLAKELAGTGVRMEDNVVVTAGEAEVLNKGCPETVQELEQLVCSAC